MPQEEKKISPRIFLFISICFFLSGMCGLIYQIIWTRMLGLVFGHTTLAISTVITSFMGGLALGSYYIGIWADRESKSRDVLRRLGVAPLLLLYGILECMVGIYCLLTPYLFRLVEFIYMKCSFLSFFPMNILRFVLCLAVLIIPTFCMGGTLPLISKFLTGCLGEVGKKLGWLYFINTVGAATGTILAGFFLIKMAGVTVTLQCAAIINIGIGLLIYSLNRNPANLYFDSLAPGEESSPLSMETFSPSKDLMIVIVFAFTGFASMVYEIAWTRALSLAIGSSTYAFSAMLASFLFGIALGSILYSSALRLRISHSASFGWLEISIGVSCLLCIPLLGKMPLLFIMFFPMVKNSYTMIIAVDFLLCFAVMLIPTTLMGIVFPLVGKLYTRKIEFLGKSIGNIYAINTVGCIAGSFLTGFVLIPFAGVQNSLKIAVLINLIGGTLILFHHYNNVKARVIAVSAIFMMLVCAHYIPLWNPTIMSSGSAVYTERYVKESQSFLPRKVTGDIVFYKDGISATVSVHKVGEEFALRINGKADASTSRDMATQLLLGYIPVLYHRDPREVYILGLGSGITAKAVLDFPEIEHVECAEIEPAVVEAERFFAPFNGNVRSNPRFTLKVTDGRNGLLAASEKYDIIISEPSNPWVSGMANLFSREFYEICRRQLKPGGVMCAWLHIYSMHPDDVKMILNTFFSVFPEGAIWQGTQADLFLIGSLERLTFDYRKLEANYKKNPGMENYLRRIGIESPDALLAHYVLDRRELEPLFSTSGLNTDDYPILEFSAPRSLYLDTLATNIRGVYAYKSSLLPATDSESVKLTPQFFKYAFESIEVLNPEYAGVQLESGLKQYPDDPVLRILHINRLFKSGQILATLNELQECIKRNPLEYRFYLALAKLYQNQGSLSDAEKICEKAYELKKDDMSLVQNYIMILLQQNKIESAKVLIQSANGCQHINIQILQAQILRKTGRGEKAEELLQELLNKNPRNFQVLRELFSLYSDEKEYSKLIELSPLLLEQSPYDIQIIMDTAKAYLATGKEEDARKLFVKVLECDPFNREINEILTK